MPTTKELKEFEDPLGDYLYKKLEKTYINYDGLKNISKKELEKLLKQKTDWFFKLSAAYNEYKDKDFYLCKSTFKTDIEFFNDDYQRAVKRLTRYLSEHLKIRGILITENDQRDKNYHLHALLILPKKLPVKTYRMLLRKKWENILKDYKASVGYERDKDEILKELRKDYFKVCQWFTYMTKLAKNSSSHQTKAYSSTWHAKSLGLSKHWLRDRLPSRRCRSIYKLHQLDWALNYLFNRQKILCFN
tara:strand:+ start:2672 stop:3409 length:738 start_codon:yes stop_codon:yes gene_type:complete